MQPSLGYNAAWLGAMLAAAAVLLYLFVFDVCVVPGDDPALAAAVEPTLKPMDRILTRRGSRPTLGELARCTVPDGSGKLVIGRVFGASGDAVEVDNERVAVNGKSARVRSSCGKTSMVSPVSGVRVPLLCSVEDGESSSYGVLLHAEVREKQRTATIERGKLFLVSDNRHLHRDSRDFGQVDAATCERVVFRLWGERFTDGLRWFNFL